MSAAPVLAEQLAEVARELADAGDVHAVLQGLVTLAVQTIEVCEHAGISVAVGDHIETPAQSDPVPAAIDRIQVDLGEGPYRDAIRDRTVFATGDLAREQRWSQFAAEVVARTGVHSMLVMPLFIDQETIGSLNLYATTVDAFDDDAHTVASLFATHAAVALGVARQHQVLAQAAATHDADVIGKAEGLLMVHQQTDAATAVEQMRARAQTPGHDLRQVADEIVENDRRA